MTQSTLTTLVKLEEGRSIVELFGEINGLAEEKLNSAYTETETHHTSKVELCFQDVTYINSTGIALIVGLLAKARQTKRELVVSSLNDHYLEIFKITRLADFMTIV